MRKRFVYFSLRKRLVYFSLSLAAALVALIVQVPPPPAAAQPKEPTAECVACEESCNAIFQACTAERGTRGPGFASCMRARQDCRQACNARGGPCHPQSDEVTPTPEPLPTPTPMPTPD